MNKKHLPKKDKFFFKIYKQFLRIFKKRVKFVYIDKKYPKGSLILSNHDFSNAPLAWELFSEEEVRLLGTEEMNSGIVRIYKYLSKIYFHQAHGFNIVLSCLISIVGAPIVYLFYKGLNLISIRHGISLKKTFNDSVISLMDYKETLVMFPEDSTHGYLEEVEKFMPGFVLICETALKRGYDVPLVVSYFKRKEKKCIVDSPILYTELKNKYKTKENMAEALKNRCNELGKSNY